MGRDAATTFVREVMTTEVVVVRPERDLDELEAIGGERRLEGRVDGRFLGDVAVGVLLEPVEDFREAAAFAGLYFFAVPFPLIIAAAAAAGVALQRALPGVFQPSGHPAPAASRQGGTGPAGGAPAGGRPPV